MQQSPLANDFKEKRVQHSSFARRQIQQWVMKCRAVNRSATVAVFLGALVCIVFVEGLSFAATPRSGRFLDRLLRATEVTPQLISVPVPRPPTTSERRAGQKKLLSVPAEEEKKPIVSADIYSWESFVRFAEGFQNVGEHVVRVAVDPSYSPDDKPQFEPIFDASELAVIEEQRALSSAGRASERTQTPIRATSISSNPYASKKSIGAMPPKSPRLQRLRVRIAQTLATYQRRPMNTSHHSPWEIMHGFVGFGIPTKIRAGGPRGELVNAIGWMNSGGRCRGQVMLTVRDNKPHALYGVGLQGHSAQYLAILAQCRVSAKSPLLLDGQNFTVANLIEDEKLNCRSGTELTFALIGLAHYLPTDAVWRSSDGEMWSLDRLMQEEINQPIRTAPCGGTHRLFSLAYGCQRRLRATGKLDGVYQRANIYVREYQNLTLRRLQNRDGSFSTEWFKYPDDRDDDVDRKVQTTGHILEWLVASLDQERLYENRIIAAAEFIATALAREPGRNWKDGPLGHALHSLSIYQERVWGVVLPGNVVAFTGPMKAAVTVGLARSDEEIRQATLPNNDKTRQ
ncbi:MAG: hypothetical protein CMJ66_12495 [Planctomycetaceae bacterium]|nr:hypothetical protein [Planctomycetaceae bacterium]